MPIFAILQTLGSGLWSFLSSRFGQICLAFVVAWLWSGSRANDHWRAVIASERAAIEAAYRAEVARQAEAAREIAEAATARAEEDAAIERELRARIDDFNAQESSKNAQPSRTVGSPAPACRPCVIDHNFTDVVRHIDAAGARKAKSPRRAR